MYRILFVLCLVGCNTTNSTLLKQSESTLTMNDPVVQQAIHLSDRLNAKDQAALLSLMQPEHPFSPWEPDLSQSTEWRALVEQWLDELLIHADSGQWQLRHLVDLGEIWRAEYRLIFSDYSVEYFFFDLKPEQFQVIDIGNHLYELTQVELMTSLYRSLLLEQESSNRPLTTYLAQLQGSKKDSNDIKSLLVAYQQLPEEMKSEQLVRELTLRVLNRDSLNWYLNTPEPTLEKLQGVNYSLMAFNHCLNDLVAQCRSVYLELPELLRDDVAVQTEMGIRALHRGELPQAQRYAEQALLDDNGFMPSYWLKLQVALGLDDHPSAIDSLDALSNEFNILLEKEILFQIYPDAGQRLLASSDFRNWAREQEK